MTVSTTKDSIARAVENMLQVNLAVREGERILILTDLPTPAEWGWKSKVELKQEVDRAFLGKAVAEIAAERFPVCRVEFLVYPSVGNSGTEPGEEVAGRMMAADVVVALTTHSLTHTDARVRACQAGARVASMPGFLPEMFAPDGPLTADYHAITALTRTLADRLTAADTATVRSPRGTEITFSIRDRPGRVDGGLILERGRAGNLPAGEALIAPVEGTAQGHLVVEKDWYPALWFPPLTQDMELVFKDGMVAQVRGGGEAGRHLADLLGLGMTAASDQQRLRRHLAELGIGTNPKARSRASMLEMEKILGTVHLAIGDSAHIGGAIHSDFHRDFMVPQATLLLDGEPVVEDGHLLVDNTR